MFQCVMIVFVLVGKLCVLIVDELMIVFDVIVQVQIFDLFCQIQWEDGIVIIFIIYDIGVVVLIVDRVVVFYVGQVVEEGLVDDVLINLFYLYMCGLFVLVFDFWFEECGLVYEIFGMLFNQLVFELGCCFEVCCLNFILECMKW